MSTLLAALLLAFQALSGPSVAAQAPVQEVAVTRAPAIPRRVSAVAAPVQEVAITATSAAVLDAQSGVVLWGKRPYTVRPLASVTKLLTALAIAREEFDGATTIAILPEDIPHERNTVFRVGDTVRADDLLTAMLVRSDNGAARALARWFSSSRRPRLREPLAREEGEVLVPRSPKGEVGEGVGETAFVVQAMRLARSLALPSVRVADPAGLHQGNTANAVDAARIVLAALGQPVIADRLALAETPIVVDRSTGAEFIAIRSTNLLLHDGRATPLGFLGGKTGYLDESGYNFVAAFERNGHRIAVAILGAASDEDRFRDAEALARWTFNSFTW